MRSYQQSWTNISFKVRNIIIFSYFTTRCNLAPLRLPFRIFTTNSQRLVDFTFRTFTHLALKSGICWGVVSEGKVSDSSSETFGLWGSAPSGSLSLGGSSGVGLSSSSFELLALVIRSGDDAELSGFALRFLCLLRFLPVRLRVVGDE